MEESDAPLFRFFVGPLTLGLKWNRSKASPQSNMGCAALIAVVIITAVTLVGTNLTGVFNAVAAKVHSTLTISQPVRATNI